jgi:hypothetical protein
MVAMRIIQVSGRWTTPIDVPFAPAIMQQVTSWSYCIAADADGHEAESRWVLALSCD